MTLISNVVFDLPQRSEGFGALQLFLSLFDRLVLPQGLTVWEQNTPLIPVN